MNDTLYGDIRAAIMAAWAAGWTDTTAPVFWLAQDVRTPPDPSVVPRFLRLELLYGREKLLAYGAGRYLNQRTKYGSLVVRVYQDVSILDPAPALALLSQAETIFRAYRVGPLGFIGAVAGFDDDATGNSAPDSGNWTMQGSLLVWEYRFTG